MMDLTKLKKLVIGGIELKQLLINGIQVWKSGYKNWVEHSTEADGVTIYNGGLGYKNGYRVRSGGAEGAADNAACTGFIPVDPGDKVIVSGVERDWGTSYNNAFNAYYEDFTLAGQVAGNGAGYYQFGSNKVWEEYGFASVVQKDDDQLEWVVPPTVSEDGRYCRYIRVSGYISDGAKLIVTINEEIT